MRIEVVDDLAAPVGELWRDRQRRCIDETGSFNVAAPLSSTPLPVYEWVIERAAEFGSWSSVSFVLMDEQLDDVDGTLTYVAIDDPASYEGFAERHLLRSLRQASEAEIPIIKPRVDDIAAFDVRIDLLVLALGVGGNYANVMPGTPRATGWHIAELLPEFRQAHTAAGSPSYAGATFREIGMSLGPQQVIDAGEVVVISSGAHKASLVAELLSMDGFDPRFPLSIVHEPSVASRATIVVTRDAAG